MTTLKQMMIGCLLLSSVWLSAQNKTDSTAVNFHLKFNNTPLVLNQQYVSGNKDSLTIETFKCYLSLIKVQYADDTVFSESDKFHLLDAENPKSLQIQIPKTEKIAKSFTFDVGIDSLTSTSGAMTGDLDPINGMYWAWQSGYINLKIEGKSTVCKTRNHEFQFHIGGYLKPNDAIQTVNLVNAERKTELNVTINLDDFFSQIDLSKLNSVMIPSKAAVELANKSKKMFYLE